MAQSDILSWLVTKRRASPEAVFSVTEIAKGSGMGVSNASKAVAQLVSYGQLEEVVIPQLKKSCYRVSKKTFSRVTGMLEEELLA